jgi:uncharacterized protein (TIGR03437 family)
VRKLLLLLISVVLPAQTLQFAVVFGSSCGSIYCDMLDLWVPDTLTNMAVDSVGNIYVAGTAFGRQFPSVNPIESTTYGVENQLGAVELGYQSTPFVAKVDSTGTKLLYATPIGLAQPGEPLLPIALAIDSGGNAYVTGAAPSGGFPTLNGTTPQTQSYNPPPDHVFFIKLDPNGKLLLSTQFGGSSTDSGNAIKLDSSGFIWIAGTTQSSDFPVTTGPPLSSSQEMFLARLDPTFGSVTYATLLGQGSSPQLAMGPSGDFLIAASTTSSSWQTTQNALQAACAGTACADIIALRFRPSNSQTVYATYLGGTGVDTLGGIAADSSGSLYLTGTTASPDFPTTPGAFLSANPCNAGVSTTCGTKAFVAHLNPSFTALNYSTYLGGSAVDQGQAMAIDSNGDAYIAGKTTSSDFPVIHGYQATIIPSTCGTQLTRIPCGGAGFAAELNPQGSALTWSTYLGQYPFGFGDPATTPGEFNGAEAIAVDPQANVYVAGDDLGINATNINPVDSPVLSTALVDASVVKIAHVGTPLTINALTNAASFAEGLPLGGGLASLFLSGLPAAPSLVTGSGDPLPTTLSGFMVKVGGEAAPLLAVATNADGSGQINFQVPVDHDGGVIEIDYHGVATFLGGPPVAPGIFTLSDGTPAIQHAADYSLVTSSNPISPGEVIIIYATGLGDVTQTGVPSTAPMPEATPPLVNIASTACAVLYAGPTPGSVGLDQINCQTSSNLSAGSQPLQVIYQPGASFATVIIPASETNSNIVSVSVK